MSQIERLSPAKKPNFLGLEAVLKMAGMPKGMLRPSDAVEWLKARQSGTENTIALVFEAPSGAGQTLIPEDDRLPVTEQDLRYFPYGPLNMNPLLHPLPPLELGYGLLGKPVGITVIYRLAHNSREDERASLAYMRELVENRETPPHIQKGEIDLFGETLPSLKELGDQYRMTQKTAKESKQKHRGKPGAFNPKRTKRWARNLETRAAMEAFREQDGQVVNMDITVFSGKQKRIVLTVKSLRKVVQPVDPLYAEAKDPVAILTRLRNGDRLFRLRRLAESGYYGTKRQGMAEKAFKADKKFQKTMEIGDAARELNAKYKAGLKESKPTPEECRAMFQQSTRCGYQELCVLFGPKFDENSNECMALPHCLLGTTVVGADGNVAGVVLNFPGKPDPLRNIAPVTLKTQNVVVLREIFQQMVKDPTHVPPLSYDIFEAVKAGYTPMCTEGVTNAVLGFGSPGEKDMMAKRNRFPDLGVVLDRIIQDPSKANTNEEFGKLLDIEKLQQLKAVWSKVVEMGANHKFAVVSNPKTDRAIFYDVMPTTYTDKYKHEFTMDE